MSELTGIKGIGEKRAALFKKLGIVTKRDLLSYFPRTYEDRSRTVPIIDAVPGSDVCIKARAYSAVHVQRIRKNMTIYSMLIKDESDTLKIIWYNNKYVQNNFVIGQEYVFFGKVVLNRGIRQMVNPVYERADKNKSTGRVVPVYPLCEGLTQNAVRAAVEQVIDERGSIKEIIPTQIRNEYRLCELNFAYKNIHFPESLESYNIARRRFVFEELFLLQLALLARKGTNSVRYRKPYTDLDVSDFVKKLSFELTGAQKRVINDIARDMKSNVAMSRLVQGDVGSGKTAVAACAMYIAVKNGEQAVLMAPTEILATQHYESLSELFSSLGMRAVLLTSQSKEKKKTLKLISDGEADIVIGTHAVIQKQVEFARLGLAVTDEQHRFGVEQRNELIKKGENVNVLVMTATPIPRTLALILYGDLQSSILDELPPGRKPVKTYAVGENMRKRVYSFLDKNIEEGMQGYVICPLVTETEKSDLENAVSLCEKLRKAFPERRVGLVHGKMKAQEKNEVMDSFVKGDVDILVSTTVIEVGVNVPNSNIMIIENAERFGLSQLHQLRGRVGRGSSQAYCILISHSGNEITKKRMETMCVSTDGFYIAEQDLKLRGPGDFFGTRQHGLPEMKIANLFEDADILSLSQQAAKSVIDEDPGLEMDKNKELKEYTTRLISSDSVMN